MWSTFFKGNNTTDFVVELSSLNTGRKPSLNGSQDPMRRKATTLNLSSHPRALKHGKNINLVGQSLNILTYVEFRGEEWHLKLS